MPAPVSLEEIISGIKGDLNSNYGSKFTTDTSVYQETVNALHETFESDKATLVKIKKSLKSFSASGHEHVNKQLALCDILENLSDTGLHSDVEEELQEIGSGICKYSVVLRNLAMRYQTQMKQLTHFLLFPLNTCLKDTLGHDIRKPFDKALKDLNTKIEKVRKDRIQAAKEAGRPKPNPDSLVQPEDVEREKKALQLHLCEYLIGVNELHSKKGAEFLLHLIDFFQLQRHYFQEGKETMEHLSIFLTHLQDKVSAYKTNQDEQKRTLISLKDDLKRWQTANSSRNSVLLDSNTMAGIGSSHGGASAAAAAASNGIPGTGGYSIHQRRLPPDNHPTRPLGAAGGGGGAGVGGGANASVETEMEGILYKRSESKVKRQWLKRRVVVRQGQLHLYHGDKEKKPIGLPLLTCQLKDVYQTSAEGNAANPSGGLDADNSNNLCFDLVSNNRTYHFMAEREYDKRRWMTVIETAREQVFQTAMHSTPDVGGSPNPLLGGEHHRRQPSSSTQLSLEGGVSVDTNLDSMSSHIPYSQQMFVHKIRALPGNNTCADCDCQEPDWVSINLGILICLECCGVHRQLGVHLSRTQSLAIDNLSPVEMLLPRFVGNSTFNDVFEATMINSSKPSFRGVRNIDEIQGMNLRKSFIMAKYKEKKFVSRVSMMGLDQGDLLYQDLLIAVRQASLSGIIQVYGEQCELLRPLPASIDDEQCQLNNTALHSAVYYGGFSADSGFTHITTECNKAEPNNLACVAFLLQNSSNSNHLYHTNVQGENVLHYCSKYNHPEAMKLIIKACGTSDKMLTMLNHDGDNPLQVAEKKNHVTCKNLLQHLTEMIAEVDKKRLTSANSAVSNMPSSNWAFVLDLNTKWFDSDEEDDDPGSGSMTPVAKVDVPIATPRRSLHESLLYKENADTIRGNSQNSVMSLSNEDPYFKTALKPHQKYVISHNIGSSAESAPTAASSISSYSTLPRKKNPAPPPPPPPPLQTPSMSSASVSHSPTAQQAPTAASPSTANVPRPTIAPKPRISSAASVSGDSRAEEKVSTFTSQTLPRKLHSSTRRGVIESGLHTVGENDDEENSSMPLRRSLLSSHSQSTEHINVLLDVLEEPAPYLTLNPRSSKREKVQEKDPDSVIASAIFEVHHAKAPAKREPNSTVPVIGRISTTDESPTTGLKRRVRALYDCDAESEEDLEFRRGDILVITSSAYPNWWTGYLENNPSKSGIFPANYVEDLEE